MRNCYCRMLDDHLEYLLTLTYCHKSRNIASCVTWDYLISDVGFDTLIFLILLRYYRERESGDCDIETTPIFISC